MENLKLKSPSGVTVVTKDGNGLVLQVPAGMNGKELEKMKKDNADALAVFKEESPSEDNDDPHSNAPE